MIINKSFIKNIDIFKIHWRQKNMRISEKFNLQVSQFELDFVDVDFNNDCRLYIDPFQYDRIRQV